MTSYHRYYISDCGIEINPGKTLIIFLFYHHTTNTLFTVKKIQKKGRIEGTFVVMIELFFRPGSNENLD